MTKKKTGQSDLADRFTFETQLGRKCYMSKIGATLYKCWFDEDMTGGRIWNIDDMLARLKDGLWVKYQVVND